MHPHCDTYPDVIFDEVIVDTMAEEIIIHIWCLLTIIVHPIILEITKHQKARCSMARLKQKFKRRETCLRQKPHKMVLMRVTKTR